MELSIKQFDLESLNATKESWISSADNLGIPNLENERLFDWAAQRINYVERKGDSYAYGIFEGDSKEAVAIVDLVYTSRSNGDVGWLKMLEVLLSPALAPSQLSASPTLYKDLLDVYASAVIGTISLTSDHKARVVKLFGRDDDLLKLFIALNEKLHLVLPNAKSKMEGRWLVITSQ